MVNKLICKACRTILSKISYQAFLFFVIGNISIGTFFFIQFYVDGNTSISSFPEWFIWNINDMNQLLLIYSVFYVILCLFQCNPSKKHHLKLLKYKTIQEWSYCTIISIVIFSISYVIFLLLLCFLQSVGTMNFTFKWSTLSEIILPDIYERGQYDNLIFLLISNCINLILYFISLGLFVLCLTLLFKNTSFVGLITIGKLIFELAVLKSMLSKVYSFLDSGNVILNLNTTKLNDTVNWIYWIIHIFILVLFIIFIVRKKYIVNEGVL